MNYRRIAVLAAALACVVVAVALVARAARGRGLKPATAELPEHSRESLAEVDGLEHDYDCNSDGTSNCGKWDYNMGTCKNNNMCAHRDNFSDLTLGQSCRCQRCAGGAGADPMLQAPGTSNLRVPFKALYWGTWRNWADHLNTCSPWLMPKHDDDIRALLQLAHTKGYKVRISGSAHSAGGIVTDGKDPSVLVVSLAEYTAPGEWEFGLHDMPDGSKRATINAGLTQLHLFQRIRPLGFSVPAQTAGYFFSIGGIVANSVHGGGYGNGFIHGYTTRMRVMTHDDTIRIIDSEAEMRFWRCSFGLLGIILGVELRLERREQLQMSVTKRRLESWSPERFWEFIKQDAEADLPSDSVPAEGGSTGSRSSFNGGFFVDFMGLGDRPGMAAIVMKANSSADADFNGTTGVPRDVEESYAKIRDETVTDGRHGNMTWGQAARRFGAPPLKIEGVDVQSMLEVLPKGMVASSISHATIEEVEGAVQQSSEQVNDGFFLRNGRPALCSTFFVKPSDAFRAMDFLKQVQQESLLSDDFVWNMPGEFRFIGVQDTAVLQPVPEGVWVSVEMLSFAELAQNHQAWKRAFKKVEDFWVKELGGKPHLGKLFGFETSSSGEVEPFGDRSSCSVYSDAAKDQFEAYRASQDPEGLFATGLGMKFLKKC